MNSNEYSLKGLKRIGEYAKGNKLLVLKAVILIFLSVLSGIVSYLLVYPIIKELIKEGFIENNMLMFFCIGIALAGIMKSIFFNKGLEASHEAAYAILYKMRVKIAEKMVKMPLGDVNERGAGSFKRKFVDDIESVEIILAHLIPEGIPYLLAPIIVYTIIFITDWRMGLLSLGSLPFGLLAMGVMMKVGYKRMPKAYEATNKMNKTIIEYINGMEVIKIFGRSTDSYQRYKSSVNNYKKYILDWWKNSWPWMAIYSVLLPCTIMFMLPFGYKMYLNGKIELEIFVFCILMAISLGAPLVKFMRFIPAIPQLAQRINEVEKIYDNKELIEGEKTIDKNNLNILYKEVCFAYKDKDVLNNISFNIPYGTINAIVGESGSGKSTIAKLLVHYWDVKKGAIKIGDIDIRDVKVEELMNYISYVDQDTFLFDISIMENIRLGNLNATDEEVIEASKKARCHDFIMNFSNGYNTAAGDAGNKLSGGQKQRITLARAILKNAPIIVLDEATAYSDPENEDKIQEALSKLTEGKTVIVIAHRLSTIVSADQIIVMDNGKIIGKDTHNNLIKDNIVYKKLWNAHQKSMSWELEVGNSEREVKHA